jgi:uncharacterized RDD family membrane protein YckC
VSDGPTWPDNDDQNSGSTPPPPPPPPPAPPSGARGGQPADIGIRIGARLIDFIILMIVNAVIIVPFIIGSIFADVTGSAAFGLGGGGVGGFVAGLIATAINVGYFVWLESSRGMTVGKQLLKLRVVSPNGGNPTVEEAFRRNAWMLASLIPVVGGLVQLGLIIWIIVTVTQDPSKQGVHDKWGNGTQVVTTS